MFKGGLDQGGEAGRDSGPEVSAGAAPSAPGRAPKGRAPIVPVLMCGGAGSRLWPLSNETTPKQFHAFAGDRSMFQLTLERLYTDGRDELCAPIIVTGERYVDLVREQLAELDLEPLSIVLEPMGRNTAPVAVIASLLAREHAPEARVLLLPADHIIGEPERLYELIQGAAGVEDRIITFGVRPDRPETGYGYIRRGRRLDGEVFEIERFTEKPDLARAEAFVKDPEFCWNAGFFLFPPSLLLAEMGAYQPDVLEAADASLTAARRDGPLVRLDPARFAGCPSISIDYAVMEKTRKAAVAACDVPWSDVGSWKELWRLGPADARGNVARGEALVLDSDNCLVHATSRKVAVLGLTDVVVVETPDAVLVLPIDRSQDVKAVVEALASGAPPTPAVRASNDDARLAEAAREVSAHG
ncbi:mannose-1-phosphate guanylyltransferase/mannose-6-phosphate isomerase [Phenylobacterium terrae]|uniref:Mannose-1-phosphate guanylyltransferase/mannose-6-phosphate isomerase n=1 Tax=Phenylobacterium terrae TaxID=2665495 RepID=A0ABW4N603_9CAUL